MAEFHGARLTVYDALTSMGRMRPEVSEDALQALVVGPGRRFTHAEFTAAMAEFTAAVQWLEEHGLVRRLDREMWTVPVTVAARRWDKVVNAGNAPGGSGTPGVPLEAATQPAVHTHQGRLFP